MRENQESKVATGTRVECAEENHKFEVIYNGMAPLGTVDVIRWCSACGALRVDIESVNGSKTRKSILRIPTLVEAMLHKTRWQRLVDTIRVFMRRIKK